VGRHMKVHGQLLGHRSKAELARRTLPVSDKPRDAVFTVTFTWDNREDAEVFADFMAKFWDDDRTECICLDDGTDA